MSAQDVFISYARGSAQSHARAACEELRARGRSVFLDEREIPDGSEFPHDIAGALTGARVILIFLDERYVTRPFCIHELQVATALARASRAAGMDTTAHIVVALPASGNAAAVVPYLPPSLANRSWPLATETARLASLVEHRLREPMPPLGERLQASADDSVRRLRVAGRVLAPSAAVHQVGQQQSARVVTFTQAMPDSHGDGFIGREHDLWRLFDALVTPRAFGAPVGCTVQGPGGSGKSQLAAEFAWRYGRLFFPAGTVWIDARADEAGLADQFARLLRALDDRITPPDSFEDDDARLNWYAGAVRDAIRGRGHSPILWIVDNVPEPGGGRVPPPIQRWCPASERVALLCTSRRAGIEGVPSTIDLAPLATESAIELLTRPPVDRSWLQAGEWSELARWVGELPLALTILRDSLANGFTTAGALARARRQEPAAVVDSLVDSLRGEVAEAYLRGVAEAFDWSYSGLAPELREAAHLFARLASMPIEEDALAMLMPPHIIGRLAKRSWIQAAGGASIRRWSMHSIPASFLRTRISDAPGEYARLFAWLHALVTSDVEQFRESLLDRHVQVIVTEFLQNPAVRGGAASDAGRAIEAARAFATQAALVGLPDSKLRGVRYLGAGLASALGVGAEVVAKIGDPRALSEEAASRLPYVLRAMSDVPEAAVMLEQLVTDPRASVRRAAITRAYPPRLLNVGLAQIRGILQEPDTAWQETMALSVDGVLGPENPRLAETIDWLLDRLADGSPTERTGAAHVLNRLLIVHRDQPTLLRHRVADIARALLTTALSAEDEGLATAAADAGGTAFSADHLALVRQALDAAKDGARLDRAIAVLVAYLSSAQRPAPPKIRVLEGGRDGSLRFEGQLGAHQAVPASAYELLLSVLELASTLDLRVRVTEVFARGEGISILAAEVGRLLDSGEYTRVLQLADLYLRCSQGVTQHIGNGQWWRAQALEALGRRDEALAAYDAAIDAIGPGDRNSAFLYERRAMLHVSEGRFDRALGDLDRAVQLVPDSFRAHHLRSLALYNLERHAEAQAAAERAIELQSTVGEAWFFRAVARYAQGDITGACDDLEKAVELNPEDERAVSFLGQVRAYLGR